MLNDDNVDVVLNQETWLVNNSLRELVSKGFTTFHVKTEGKLRSCILAKIALIFTLLLAVVCRRHGLSIRRMNQRTMRTHQTEPAHQNSGFNIVIGCVANALLTHWGSININRRDESLFDYLLNSYLHKQN